MEKKQDKTELTFVLEKKLHITWMHTFVSSLPGKPIYKSFLCSDAARSGVKSTIKQNLELSRVTISGHLPFLIPPHDSPLAVISMNSDGIYKNRW